MGSARQRLGPVSRRRARPRASQLASTLRRSENHPAIRLLFFGLACTLWIGLILFRLWDLQVRRTEGFVERAQRQQESLIEIGAKRGEIFDRFGAELARSTPVDSIGVFPTKVTNPQTTAELLSEVLGIDPDALAVKLTKTRFQWVKRLAEPGEAERVRELPLDALHFEKESKRYYPKGTVASHILGAVGVDHGGLAGIEQFYEELLRGRPGQRLVHLDALRKRYESRAIQQPVPGLDLVLTIDQRIQMLAERELARAIGETQSAAGTIVILDPNNGDLLALASWPTFNPNEPVRGKADVERRRNYAVSHMIEPGSTFKLITFAAALEEGLATPDEVLDCQNGAIYIGSRRIRDHKPFGFLTVADVLTRSSNVGTIKLGLRLQPERLHDYIRRLGFGSATALPLPGEAAGLVRHPDAWSGSSIGSISIGQEVGVTAVQLGRAVSAIANGGLLIELRLIDTMVHPDGRREQPASRPAPRVLRPETAATLRAMMERTVLQGTARLAQTPGYRVGGKTGTAQKIDRATGAYSTTAYVSSFVGFAPVNDPSIVVVIVLDSPVGRYYGGLVAAPVFPRVVTEALRFRDVPLQMPLAPKPSEPPSVPEELLADFLGDGQPVADESERAAAAEYTPTGERVVALALGAPLPQVRPVRRVPEVSPFPAQSASVEDPSEADGPATEAAALPAPPAPPEPVVIRVASGVLPSFQGHSVREVVRQSSALGLRLQVRGRGTALRQWPAAGTPMQPGRPVTVEFRPQGRGVLRTQ